MRKRKYVALREDDGEPHARMHDLHGPDGAVGSGAGGGGGSDQHQDAFNHSATDPTTTTATARLHDGTRGDDGCGQYSSGDSLPALGSFPIPQCHNIVSTSQILTSQPSINLQRLADLFPFTTYDRKRFAAITIRLANPHCTCLLFGSGKLVITGSTSFSACIVASHEITRILRRSSPRDTFEVSSCQIQNLVAHVSLRPGTTIDLNRLYERFNEQSTYQRSIFPGLVLRPPRSPIVLLIFTSGRIVCTGGRSYDDIFFGFAAIYDTLKPFIHFPVDNDEAPVSTIAA
jgi:transcription initiation factor TFIID TATA-box-binding protein